MDHKINKHFQFIAHPKELDTVVSFWAFNDHRNQWVGLNKRKRVVCEMSNALFSALKTLP